MFEFNDSQKEVIALSSGKHACIASAGAGKTEVLTERLQKALENQISPEKILCITFTNRAALSMVERVHQKLSPDSLDGVFVGNTHALALKLLKDTRYFPYVYSLCTPDVSDDLWKLAESNCIRKLQKLIPSLLEVKQEQASQRYFGQENTANPNLDRIGDEDLQPLKDYIQTYQAGELLKKLDTSFTTLSALAAFGIKNYIVPDLKSSKSKNFKKIKYYQTYSIIKPLLESVISDTELEGSYIGFVKEKLGVMYSETSYKHNHCSFELFVCITALVAFEYEKLKQQLLMYDFDDALCSSLKLPCREFSWIQVDECQDLSPVQWLIIKHHICTEAHLVMFGDINQSIYRFLGASIETTSFEIGKSKYELPINYRSPKNLVSFFKDYMKNNFPDRFQSEVKSNNAANHNALIHVHSQTEEQQNLRLLQHAKRLVEDNRNTALLCPTNALVDDVSLFFSEFNVNHFRISQNDILTRKVALDFFAFLRALNNDDDHLAWSRLLWNFGRVESLKDSDGETLFPPQLHSLYITSEIAKRGGSLSDMVASRSAFDHLLSRFNDALVDGYTYFDTETTGLNDSDDVIQIAGVNVNQGAFEGEINLYCLSNTPVGESENVHKISDIYLKQNGAAFDKQYRRFLYFSKGRTLVAHNIAFDERMMMSNIGRSNKEDLSRFHDVPKLCSLKLARRLFPHLKSHKLGDLLQEFNIEGVNSHNALDDVRAGANFLEHVRDEVKQKSLNLDAYIDKYLSLFERFNNKLSGLFNEIRNIKNEINLEYLFNFYFDYVSDNKLHDVNEDALVEFKYKLLRWSKRNFKSNSLDTYLNQIVPHILILKESDLITDDDKLVVSTIHKSKGLEFDYVLLPSVVDAKYPAYPIQNMRGGPERDMLIDEQKRLLYVGMTRAKKQLVVGTHNIFVTKYGKKIHTNPCAFLSSQLSNMKRV